MFYSALLELEPEGGFKVTFPEIGFGATYGATWDKALNEAEDMLEEAIGQPGYRRQVSAASVTHQEPHNFSDLGAPIGSRQHQSKAFAPFRAILN